MKHNHCKDKDFDYRLMFISKTRHLSLVKSENIRKKIRIK